MVQTLATLYPDRIDLGLDEHLVRTAHASGVKEGSGSIEYFPQDVVELQALLGDLKNRIHAIPGENTNVPLWILGSSLFGAQLAAALGLPYAFASFCPPSPSEAVAIYRERFQPRNSSKHLT